MLNCKAFIFMMNRQSTNETPEKLKLNNHIDIPTHSTMCQTRMFNMQRICICYTHGTHTQCKYTRNIFKHETQFSQNTRSFSISKCIAIFLWYVSSVPFFRNHWAAVRMSYSRIVCEIQFAKENFCGGKNVAFSGQRRVLKKKRNIPKEKIVR